jgi:isopenicillin-N epimerase
MSHRSKFAFFNFQFTFFNHYCIMPNTSLPDYPAIQPDAWTLDPTVTFLNHGSFGACPRVVLEKQQELRRELEREPVDFLVRKMTPMVDENRNALATLIGADPTDMVFVQNATAGVNSVVRSLKFKPGDEILVTAHDYNACRNVIRYTAQQTGAVVVEVKAPLPITSPQQIVDAVLERVTARTRLAMLDHITSPTALVYPVEQLVRELDRRGVDTLVDGAHTPGMIPFNVNRIGAAYYTGNCHKWLCTPKAVGFLHVRRDRQQGIQPPIISHGWNRPRPGYTPFQDGFDWPGTLDPTPWLCIGESLRFLSGLLPGGLEALMRRNHELAVLGQRILCERLGVQPVGAESMLGSMGTVQLPDNPAAFDPQGNVVPSEEWRLNNELFANFRIEVPTFFWPSAPKMLLRVCAQAYNHPAQYEQLAEAIKKSVAELG